MRFVRVLGLVAVVAVASFAADPAAGNPDRVARLVRQLGDRSFGNREAASRELAAVGEPARPALIKAAADADAEVARRARLLLDGLDARALAAAARKELARWEGEWTGNGGQRFLVKGDRWAWGAAGPQAIDERNWHTVLVVAVTDKLVQADMVVTDPLNGPRICHAIFRLDGDTLHYCGTYDLFRPTEFRGAINQTYVPWKRVKK